MIVYPGHCNCYYGPVWPGERLSLAWPLSYQSWGHPQQPLGLWLKYAINLDNLCIISTLYTRFTGSALRVWREWECRECFHESILVHLSLCCEFYNVVPGHCFSVERESGCVKGLVTCSCSVSPLSLVPTAAIKRSGQIILQQNWFHIRSLSPISDLTAS